MVVGEVEVIHIGRRIHSAQRAVERQGAGFKGARAALRDLHLHQFARHDLVLAAAHGIEERALGERALDRRTCGRLDRRVCQHQRFGKRAHQPVTQALQPVARLGERMWLARIGIRHQVELAEHVVDHRELVGHQQQYVRRA